MRMVKLLGLVLAVMFLAATPLFAQESPSSVVVSGAGVGAGLGAALTIIGAGYGFGKIGSAAMEGMARQPETAGRIQTGMIIIGALLEGATFFALLVCLLISFNVTW